MHAEAAELLRRSLRLAPASAHPQVAAHTRAYLGFVLGQPLLRDYVGCAQHLMAGLDADPTVRRRLDAAKLMVGTLDNCLTRLGRDAEAHAVREFAVQVGVWRHADRQQDGVLVEYAGMRAQPWWEPQEMITLDNRQHSDDGTGGVFETLLRELGATYPQLTAAAASRRHGRYQSIRAESLALLRGGGSAWVENNEGVHEGGRWLEITLVPLGPFARAPSLRLP
jgi:hypothetical protein